MRATVRSKADMPQSCMPESRRSPILAAGTAILLVLTLTGCGYISTRGTSGGTYAGDVTPGIPRVEVAEVTPVAAPEAAPVESVGGTLGAPVAADGAPMPLTTTTTAATTTAPAETAPRTVTPPPATEAAAPPRRAEPAPVVAEAPPPAATTTPPPAATTTAAATTSTAGAPAGSTTGAGALSFGTRTTAAGDTETSLADVPPAPTDLPTVAERDQIRADLEADRDAATGALSFGGRTGTAGSTTAPATTTAAAGVTEAAPGAAAPAAARLLGSIKFDAGSATLPAGATSTLQRLVNEIQGRVRITGYGAGDGAGLATERAQAVARALVGLGIDPSRIVIDGRADERPGVTDGTAARAEISAGG
jgi:outer membrane protein OmpA-like peptidoglycan-associated protein